jgi:RNA polymerase sigma factor (sigma-70 family)
VSHSTTTPSERANLFRRAQAGDVQAVATLMDRHERLVHYIVHQQWRGPLSYAEAVHEGRIGLWRAILGYDPQRGTAFSTYASVAIARQLWRAVRQATKEACVAPALWPATAALDPWLAAWAGEVLTALQAMVVHLPAKQRWVVCAYYGLDGGGGCTLAQLGARLGCTRQAVHYHLLRALLQLRHPAFSARLRALLGHNRRVDYLQALHPQANQHSRRRR